LSPSNARPITLASVRQKRRRKNATPDANAPRRNRYGNFRSGSEAASRSPVLVSPYPDLA
jgi:hypothetical protein